VVNQEHWQNCEKRLWALSCLADCLSVCLSVHQSTLNNSAPTGRLSMNFDICILLKNMSRKCKFHYTLTRIMCNLHKTNLHFWSYFAQFFLDWDIFHTEVVEKIKTHYSCSITFCRSHSVYEIMWKIFRARQATDNNMGYAHCMLDTKGYNMVSEYVILLFHCTNGCTNAH